MSRQHECQTEGNANRTIRIYDTAHDVARKLSLRFGISQSAVIEALLLSNEHAKTLTIRAYRDEVIRPTLRRVSASKRGGSK